MARQKYDIYERDLADCLAFLARAECAGIRFEESAGFPANFVPYKALEQYFEPPRCLPRLLAAVFRTSVFSNIPPLVRPEFYKIFAILLRIGKGSYIGHFQEHRLSDALLPFEEKPGNFPISYVDNEGFFPNFYEAQWAFCAPDFEYGHLISTIFHHGRWIFPITLREPINTGGSATVYQVKLHEAYDHLCQPFQNKSGATQRPRIEPSHTYAVKTYRGWDSSEYFRKETEAFHRLADGNKPHRDIVAYYGSFKIQNDYNIILEYADKGHLDNYFDATLPPATPRDTVRFWEGLLRLIFGLVKIHHGGGGKSKNRRKLIGFHQDLKPVNILVVSGRARSPYAYQFKITDLGTSHFKKVSKKCREADIATHGTVTYGAPELHRPDTVLQRQDLYAHRSCDIWSLGCIFSEALVWTKLGWRGLNNYRDDRLTEAQRLHLTDGDCFHDGGRGLLHPVEKMHNQLWMRAAEQDDSFTQELITMIRDMMAIEQSSRPTAQDLIRRRNVVLKKGEGNLQNSKGADDSASGSSSSRPQTPPELPPGYGPSDDSGKALNEPKYKPGEPITSLPPVTPKTPHVPLRRSRSDDILPDPRAEGTAKARGRRGRRAKKSGRARSQEAIERVKQEPEGHDLFSIDGQNAKLLGTGPKLHGEISPQAQATSQGTPLQQDLDDYPLDILFQSQTPEANVPIEVSEPQQTPTQEPHINWMPQLPTPILPMPPVYNAISRADPVPYVPSLVHPAIPIQAPQDGASMPGLPHCTVDEAWNWMIEKRAGSHVQLPPEYLLRPLRDRDHIFFIDNSATMRGQRLRIRSLLKPLAYIVEPFDPDGLDLYFGTDRNNDRPVHGLQFSKLVKEVERKPFSGSVNIARRLRKIVEDYEDTLEQRPEQPQTWLEWTKRLFGISRPRAPSRPMTVYVFTDGSWTSSCKLNLRGLFMHMEESFSTGKVNKGQVRIQLIQFGSEAVDQEALRDLIREGQRANRDFVDIEPYENGNIWKMLLGSNHWA